MVEDVVVGAADVHDPSVRRLIEPETLQSLERDIPDHSMVSALWVRGNGAAAVAARLDPEAGTAEIVSIGCLVPLRDSDATALVLRHLAQAATAEGRRLIFEPRDFLDLPTETALRAAGLRPDGPEWLWYEFTPDGVDAKRRTVMADAIAPGVSVRTLDTLSPSQVEGMRRDSRYRPHPDDLPGCSPVLLDPDGRVAAFLILRRHPPGSVVHWSWVAPDRRRSGLILVAGDALFALTAARPELTPMMFRVERDNVESRHLVERALAPAVRFRHQTRTWQSGPSPETVMGQQ